MYAVFLCISVSLFLWAFFFKRAVSSPVLMEKKMGCPSRVDQSVHAIRCCCHCLEWSRPALSRLGSIHSTRRVLGDEIPCNPGDAVNPWTSSRLTCKDYEVEGVLFSRLFGTKTRGLPEKGLKNEPKSSLQGDCV